MNKENNIKIQSLDHVAIRVTDLDVSTEWYQKVLGLKRIDTPKWREYPIFLSTGKSGIALFPANLNDPELDSSSRNIKIDHFAFNVNIENFKRAKDLYTELGLAFDIQDHHYCQSIYTKDPDGHTVELTTWAVDVNNF